MPSISSNENISNYEVYSAELGSGSFAEVYRATVKATGKEVVIKMVKFQL
jgi:serine/threonine protein kinase